MKTIRFISLSIVEILSIIFIPYLIGLGVVYPVGSQTAITIWVLGLVGLTSGVFLLCLVAILIGLNQTIVNS